MRSRLLLPFSFGKAETCFAREDGLVAAGFDSLLFTALTVAVAVAVLEEGRIFGADADLPEELAVGLVRRLMLGPMGPSASFPRRTLLWPPAAAFLCSLATDCKSSLLLDTTEDC